MAYKFISKHLFVLKPDPIEYGDKVYEIEVSYVEDAVQKNPVQLAAIHWLQKDHMWHNGIKNPLGELIFLIFNQEIPDKLNLSMSERDDMENVAYDFYIGSAEETNKFLFESTDKSIEDQERIASEVLSAKDKDVLREILIGNVMYEAMMTNFDNWPLPSPPVEYYNGSMAGRTVKKIEQVEERDFFSSNIQFHLFNENPLLFCELTHDVGLEQYIQSMCGSALKQYNSLLEIGVDAEKAKTEVVVSLISKLPKAEPITFSNGKLDIPSWMLQKEIENGVIIEDISAYGDGKALMRIRVREHLKALNLS